MRAVHENKIKASLNIQGTTDSVILSNYGAILQTMKPSEVIELADMGDVDAIRAVLMIPALRLNKKFTQQRDQMMIAAEKIILSEESYNVFQELRTESEHLNLLDIAIVERHEEHARVKTEIGGMAVDDSVQSIRHVQRRAEIIRVVPAAMRAVKNQWNFCYARRAGFSLKGILVCCPG